MFCMTCGEEKELKTPSKAVISKVEEDARSSGQFNYTRTVGFCNPSCIFKGLAMYITTTGGNGFYCANCGKVLGESCTC